MSRKPNIKGRLAKVPGRALTFASISINDFPPPPAHFDKVAVDAYWAIVAELAGSKELAALDAPLIEMASRAYARWLALDALVASASVELEGSLQSLSDKAEGIGGEISSKGFLSGLAQARAAASKDYMRCVGELGLSPSARIRSGGALQGSFMALLDAQNGKAADAYTKRPRLVTGPGAA